MTRLQYLEIRRAHRLHGHLRKLWHTDNKRHAKRRVSAETVEACRLWLARIDAAATFDRKQWLATPGGIMPTLTRDSRVVLHFSRVLLGERCARFSEREYNWLSREYLNNVDVNGREAWFPLTSDTGCRHSPRRHSASGWMNIRGGSLGRGPKRRVQWWMTYTRPALSWAGERIARVW